MTRVLLVSTYEQGHQPLGLAAPAAYLRARGHDVGCLDLAVQQPDPDRFRDVDLIAISVPMHTAARLAMMLARRLRQLVDAPIAFYGLYASELDEQLRSSGLADAVVVTCDSVSMVSEACATGKPVLVAELDGGNAKFRAFHATLREAGHTRPFRGELERWATRPPDDTERVAAEVRRRMSARRIATADPSSGAALTPARP